MKTCGYCNQEIAHNAKACPNCGGLWPVYGRSPTKLFVEKVHSIVQVTGSFSPDFESTPRTYLELLMGIILGLIAFFVAGIFFITGLSVFRALLARWTGDDELIAGINSISSFLGLGLQAAMWLVLLLILTFSIGLLIAYGTAYCRKKFKRNV